MCAKYLYSILLSIYYNDYINIPNEEKERMDKNMTLIIYLLEFQDLLNLRKKMRKTVNHRLIYHSSPSTDENHDVSDKFIVIPDMPPLEGDEKVKEGKWLKILAQIKQTNN